MSALLIPPEYRFYVHLLEFAIGCISSNRQPAHCISKRQKILLKHGKKINGELK